MIFTIGLPIMLGLSVLAQPAIAFALGPKWIDAWPILQGLALTLVPPLFGAPIGALSLATGRTDMFMRLSLVEFVIKVPAVVAGAYLYGIWGVLGARMIAYSLTCVASILIVKRLSGLSAWDQLRGPARAALAAVPLVLVMVVGRPILLQLHGPLLGIALCALAGIAMIAYAASPLGEWTLIGKPRGVEAILWNRLSGLAGLLGSRLQRRGSRP